MIGKDNAVDRKVHVADNVHIVEVVDAVDDAYVCLTRNFNRASEKRLHPESPSFGPPAVPSGDDSLKNQVGGLSSIGWIAVIDTQRNSRNLDPGLSTRDSMAPWKAAR